MPFDFAQGGPAQRRGVPFGVGRAWQAFAAYTAIAVAATWPLARGLGRDVAWDLGDSVLVMWTLAWDCEQILAILRGDFARLATFFDANIFHPAPLTLAYTEHFIPQALQILPVYAITDNPILCYNLLFLSTFVLSGLGAYLLVRELTGNAIAAFVAGLLYAFAPYRFPQSSHLHVLSSQWMPFALYALRRYFASIDGSRGRWRPLAGAALALVAQNLSSGYYLLYFSPFVAGYVLWEIAQRGVWRHWKVWTQLAVTGGVVLVLTGPFLLPYLALREQLQFVRSRSEVIRYSADVYSYATAASTFWSRFLRAYPKAEGDVFPGLVPLLLAAVAIIASLRATPAPAERRPWLARLLRLSMVAHLIATVIGLMYRRVLVDFGLFDLQISNINQMLLRAAASAALLLAVSPAALTRARELVRANGFFLVALISAMWLALGPLPQVLGRPVELAAPYGVLFEHVPGYEGVRVPARFAMISALMLAVLGGFGAVVFTRRRAGIALLAALCVAFLAESAIVPFTVNGVTPTPGYNTPEARLYRPARAPNIYKEIARQPPDAILAELPLGEPDFDLRAMFYSTVHWRPLLNGYAGFYPPHYGRLASALSDVIRQPAAAFAALRGNGATHVIVHEGAFVEDRGPNTTAALLAAGASELYRDGSDVLLRLP